MKLNFGDGRSAEIDPEIARTPWIHCILCKTSLLADSAHDLLRMSQIRNQKTTTEKIRPNCAPQPPSASPLLPISILSPPS